MRWSPAILALLILLTPLIAGGAYLCHPKAKVGIVLVGECEDDFARTTEDAFLSYDDYFTVIIIPERLDIADSGMTDSDILDESFFHNACPERLIAEYGVDIILFITDLKIITHDDDGCHLWGQANTETGSAMITVEAWLDRPEGYEELIHHVALHEVFHLLGYCHNDVDTSGIMQHSGNTASMELSPYYQVQLPARLWTYKLGLGLPLPVASIITYTAFVLILLPLLIGLEMIVYHFYKKVDPTQPNLKVLAGLNITVSFMMLMVFDKTFITILIPLLSLILWHQLYFLYIKFQRKRAEKSP